MQRQDTTNYDYVCTYKMTGVSILLKVDPPKDVELGNVKFNAKTKQSESGLILTNSMASALESEQSKITCEAVVVDIGPNAFHREGLDDMLETVQVGTRVVVDKFIANLSNVGDQEGNPTLYYIGKEHQIVGLAPKVESN
jgi:co-chaperonin GroES (HSP10)